MCSLLSVSVLDFHLIQMSTNFNNTGDDKSTAAMVWKYRYTNSCLLLLVSTNVSGPRE